MTHLAERTRWSWDAGVREPGSYPPVNGRRGVLMIACNDRAAAELSASQRAAIEEEVKRTASELLNAKDAATALSYYAPGPTVVSNGIIYPSFDSLATELNAFCGSLGKISLAVWDEMTVDVLSANAAVFAGVREIPMECGRIFRGSGQRCSSVTRIAGRYGSDTNLLRR